MTILLILFLILFFVIASIVGVRRSRQNGRGGYTERGGERSDTRTEWRRTAALALIIVAVVATPAVETAAAMAETKAAG